jgi:hypothetical protein
MAIYQIIDIGPYDAFNSEKDRERLIGQFFSLSKKGVEESIINWGSEWRGIRCLPTSLFAKDHSLKEVFPSGICLFQFKFRRCRL